MSWSLSYEGRLNESRVAGGQFAPGDILPVALTQEALDGIERGNPGCSNQAIEVWSNARMLIASGEVGPIGDRFRVSIAGHFQTPGSALENVNIHIDHLA